MRPFSRSCSGPTLDPLSNFSRSLTLIVENVFFKTAFVKPRFGMRRCNGICPPSKPRFWLLPERDHMPSCPRPAVFPCPEPGPRPILFTLCVDPGFGLSVLMPDINLLLQNPHQMRNFCDHPSDGRCVFSFTRCIQLAEPESLHNQLLLIVEADRAPVVLDSQLACGRFLLLACHDYPIISSSGFSRRRVTSFVSFRLRSPSNVALITLCGFDVPIDFVRMF